MKRWCTIAINNLSRIHPESIRWTIHSHKTPSQRATSILESLVLTRGTPRSLAASASLGKSHHHGRPLGPLDSLASVQPQAYIHPVVSAAAMDDLSTMVSQWQNAMSSHLFIPAICPLTLSRLLSPAYFLPLSMEECTPPHPAVLEKRFRPLNERDLETRGHTGETGLGRPGLGVGCHRLAEGTPSRLSHGPGKDTNLGATIGNIGDDMWACPSILSSSCLFQVA